MTTPTPAMVAGWLKSLFSAGTILTIVTIGSGLVAAHGRDRERMDELERRVAIVETKGARKTELQDRDKALVEQLHAINDRLTNIERVLMEGKR